MTVIAAAGATALCAGPAQTVDAASRDPLVLAAASAVLIEQASGRVLFQKNPDQPMMPASLAKLMTLHLVYQRLADRTIRRSDVVILSSNAWANHQVPGSSVMNLGPGQIVTVRELMKGMAIASGNDAATALAEYVAGSVPAFVRMMNDEARFMGYTTMRFTDPSGVDRDNRVSAREFADFCRRYIALHPEALQELHSQSEFDYPLPQNVAGTFGNGLETRKQYNGNWLVGIGIGVDGLKTGHLDDENFTAAITAKRGGMRLIAVVLGVPGTSLMEGSRRRAEDGLALLGYGFRSFFPMDLDVPELPPVRVWKGSRSFVAVRTADLVRLTLRPEESEQLTYMALARSPLLAPVYRGQRVGELVYSAGTKEIGRIPLFAARDVEGAGFLRWTLDSIVLVLRTVALNARDSARAALNLLHPTPVVAERAGPR